MILYFAGMLYMFLSIHVVCDEYFVASIHAIVDRYAIAEDVAGATLMAAASSAPELFAGLVGVFVEGSEEVGVGTVVGSCVFNMCVIVGGVLVVYPHDEGAPLRLGGFSLTRDSSFYLISIALLLIVFEDGRATPAESVLLFAFYLLYVAINWKFKRIKSTIRSYMDWDDVAEAPTTTTTTTTTTPSSSSSSTRVVTPWHALVTTYFGGGGDDDASSSGDAEALKTTCCPPLASDGGARRLLEYVLLPARWAFYWTIPDCRAPALKDWYVATFCAALAWLGLLVYFMLEWAKKGGCLAGISASTMGLTFCAAGTSAPDCFISLIVARGGRGKMAVCNVFGSNIFDVLLCLGLPLTISAIAYGGDTAVGNENMVFSVVLLLVLLLYVLAVSVPYKLVLSRRAGPPLLVTYAMFLIYVFVRNEA